MPAARRKTKTAAGKRKRRADGPSLTAAERKKLLDAIRLGLAKDDAIKLVGLAKSTFYDWLQRGQQPGASAAYRKFADDVEKAVAEFEHKALQRISAAGQNGEWQADAWRLERKFPDRYGRRTRVDSNVTVQAQPFIDPSKLTLAEQEQLLALLRKASPAQDDLAEGQRPALELVAGGTIDGEATEQT